MQAYRCLLSPQLMIMVQKQTEAEESHQDGPPSYDDATDCSEDFLYFVVLCSPIISFLPRRCWETETRRVNCSTDVDTASLAGTSNDAFYVLQLWTISHNPAIIHTFSYGLQLYKPSVWRASRISAASEPPWDDLSSIWIACAPYSFWSARWVSIFTLYLYTNFSLLGILAAVFWFPLGIGLCLLDRRVRCHRCGLIIEDGVCS